MELMEMFLKDNLLIDFGCPVKFDSKEIFPKTFATVKFTLYNTIGLEQITDRIRKDLGFKPLHPLDEYTKYTCDNEGWYDFTIEINDSDTFDGRMDGYIAVTLNNSVSKDNGKKYRIELNAIEEKYAYTLLDEQCQKNLRKSCDDLLKESREELEKEKNN